MFHGDSLEPPRVRGHRPNARHCRSDATILEFGLFVPHAALVVFRAIQGKFRVEGKHRAVMSAGRDGASNTSSGEKQIPPVFRPGGF
jgi:hypothetical protein